MKKIKMPLRDSNGRFISKKNQTTSESNQNQQTTQAPAGQNQNPLKNLFSRNPDLMTMISNMLSVLDVSKLEEMECNMLDANPDLAIANADMIMALYTKFGFKKAAAKLADMILK